FLGGLAGELYRQFAITIAVSVVISGIVALTLSPALCALMLKHEQSEPWWPLRKFKQGLDWLTRTFVSGTSFFLRNAMIALAIIVVMLGATWLLFERVPGALVPAEDQGNLFLVTMLPPAAALDRTVDVTSKVTAGASQNPAVENVV